MDIEEELAELKAELERSNEDPKVKRFVNGREYRVLMKKQKDQICEVCGKEYKITHLCETAWKFEWSDLWKHYAAYEVSTKNAPSSYNQTKATSSPKTFEYVKTPASTSPKSKPPNKSSNNCGACVCIIIIVVLLVIFL